MTKHNNALDERTNWYNRAAYRILKYLLWGVFRLWNRISVEGADNIPDGACIWAPNHRSYIDTPLQAAIPRRLRFMGKDSMWKNSFFIENMQCINQLINACGWNSTYVTSLVVGNPTMWLEIHPATIYSKK